MKDTIEEYKRFIYQIHDSVESLLYAPPELRSKIVIELHQRINLMIASIEQRDALAKNKIKDESIIPEQTRTMQFTCSKKYSIKPVGSNDLLTMTKNGKGNLEEIKKGSDHE